jgi:hypothetical protein
MKNNKLIFQKIDKYCNGLWKPNKKEEVKFLSSTLLKKITGNNKSLNTGKLSEWYVGEILRKNGIVYKSQPIIKYSYNTSNTQSTVPGKIKKIGKGNSLINRINIIMTRSKTRQLNDANNILINDTQKEVPIEHEQENDSDEICKTRFIQPDYYIPSKDLFIEVKSRSYNCNGTASEKLDHIVRKYSKLELTKEYKKSKLLIICSAYELFEESTAELLNYNKKTTRSYVKDFVKLSKKYNILDWVPISKLNQYVK